MDYLHFFFFNQSILLLKLTRILNEKTYYLTKITLLYWTFACPSTLKIPVKPYRRKQPKEKKEKEKEAPEPA